MIFSFTSSPDRDAVAAVNPLAIDFDAPKAALLVGRTLRAGLQRGGEHPRVGADRQPIVVAGGRFAPEIQALTEGDRYLARGYV